MTSQKAKVYTVSQVNSLIKGILENNLPGRLTVTGEITNWSIAPRGHRYFSLKDENSKVPCAMWAGNFRRVKFEPENGLAVLATGCIDVYVPHGRYQFIVDNLIPVGKGALQLAFEQMREKLRMEGLFRDEYKKALPSYPQRIGILTSESGAAVHDIKDSIHNRWPCARLFLYPVPVQGEGAAEKIAAAIRDTNKRNQKLKLDILIIGRGGGSREDLWAFNEEILARAIFDSKIPVISAVGHEIDITIADWVADARASTPTKAGVVAVPDKKEVIEVLTDMERRLAREIDSRLELSAERLQTLLASSVFRNPLLPVRNREQQLDEMGGTLEELIRDMLASAREKLREYYEQVVKIEPHRLLGRKAVDLNDWKNRASTAAKAIINKCSMQLTGVENRLVEKMKELLVEKQRRLSTSYERLVRIEPHRLLGKKAVDLNDLKSRAGAAIRVIITIRQMQLTACENRLAALNPKSVLQRGYSITTNKKTGLLVRASEDIQIADLLITELAEENLIESKVTNKQNRNKQIGV